MAYSDYNGGEEVGAGAVADWGARWEEVEPGQHNKFLAGEWEGEYAGTRPELLQPARSCIRLYSAVPVICIHSVPTAPGRLGEVEARDREEGRLAAAGRDWREAARMLRTELDFTAGTLDIRRDVIGTYPDYKQVKLTLNIRRSCVVCPDGPYIICIST